jgi:hypothetical protein
MEEKALIEKDNSKSSSVNGNVWHIILVEIMFLWDTTAKGFFVTVIFFYFSE